jgi:hypothetical protein
MHPPRITSQVERAMKPRDGAQTAHASFPFSCPRYGEIEYTGRRVKEGFESAPK